MTDHEEDTRLDHELAVEELVGAALRGGVALLTGSDEDVSPVLADVAVELIDSTGVARLDAMKGHTATAVVRALVVPLGVEADDLVDALRVRADSLPLVLVVENGECLGSRALATLRALMQKSHGGLGLVIGGDAELLDLLDEAGIDVACQRRAAGIAGASEYVGERDDVAPGSPTWVEMVPWKHLAAVAGLLLLVMIFWPADEAPESDKPRSLSLPAPAESSPDADPAPPSGSSVTSAARENAAAPDRETSARTEDAVGVQTSQNPDPATGETPPPAPVDKPAPETAEPPAPESAPSLAPQSSPDTLSVSEQPQLTGLAAELGYRQEDWLLTLADSQWMLQLTLAADEDRARAVLDQLGRAEGAYYRANRDGSSAYIVVAGPYSSREEALGARAGLPELVRTAGAFPRSMGVIQQEIAGNGDSP